MTIESWGEVYYSKPSKLDRTWWPVGEQVVPHDRLKQILAGSARHHARQAISLFVSDDHNEALQAAVSVGCAVELLAKAYLASIEHSLLAEKGERDAVLVLTGKGHLAAGRPTEIKSIGAAEALLITKHLHRTLPYNPQTDRMVLGVRNAAAHMALVDGDELRKAVMLMCRIVSDLLPQLALDAEPFWGEHSFAVVTQMLDVAQNELRRVIAAKEAAARKRLADLVKGLGEASATLVVASLSGRKLSTSDHEEPQRCPVCDQQGWLVCSIEPSETLFSGKPSDMAGSLFWQPVLLKTAYPFAFECAVCQLNLQSDELLEMGFPTEIKLEVDGSTFGGEDYEPDEDYFRGR